ncbi:MAG: guanylate kinase [Deltaproteobacteria bacterium]|nr:MAG: guanylate kinase [Deltaproteobacteria bacterium]
MAWSNPDRGALFVVTGPSGVGKSTLIAHLMEHIPGIRFSVSATTRAPREGEQDGVHYHFLTPERFAELVGDGAFLEYAEVYGRRYGTLLDPIIDALDAGESILLDVDLQGARSVRRDYLDAVRARVGRSVDDAIFVYILPPSIAVLEERLRARGTDSDEIIAGRMAKVAYQLEGVAEYDYLVVNDDLDEAREALTSVFRAELLRRSRRQSWVDAVDAELEARRNPA